MWVCRNPTQLLVCNQALACNGSVQHRNQHLRIYTANTRPEVAANRPTQLGANTRCAPEAPLQPTVPDSCPVGLRQHLCRHMEAKCSQSFGPTSSKMHLLHHCHRRPMDVLLICPTGVAPPLATLLRRLLPRIPWTLDPYVRIVHHNLYDEQLHSDKHSNQFVAHRGDVRGSPTSQPPPV